MAFLEVNFFSDALGMCMSMNVILPVTEDAVFSELRQILELNAVHNWQIIE